MRVLVYPHAMVLSGTLNAIELAAAVRDRGHEVTVLSRPGPLVETVRRLGVEHVPLDGRARRIPSPWAAAQLASLARQRRIDVINSWEWPPAVEAFFGARLRLGIPVVCSVMSMSVAPFMPRTLRLTVGSQQIADRAAAAGHTSVTLLEPPVDVRANAPEHGGGSFRSGYGLDATPLLVVVCRLAHELKLEGLLAACDAAGTLAAGGTKVQLAVVGDGPARPEVERAAAAANALAGRTVVVLTGELYDPRPAYAAADVVLGMGGSALRGMAFGKPLIVQGEHGFWELMTPESAPAFRYQGMYGIGSDLDGRGAGAQRLAGIVRALLDDPAGRARFGAYGRELVLERYSLDHAAAVLEGAYLAAMDVASRPSAAALAADAVRVGTGVLAHKSVRKWRRWREKPVAADDFNAVARSSAGGRR